MDVATAIRSQRATRQFRDEPVSKDVLHDLLDLSRRAGSGKNTQPWEFVVVRDEARLERLSTLGTYASPLAGSGAGIMIVVDSGQDDGVSRMQGFDCGRAAQNLMLAASEMGLGTVPQGLTNGPELRDSLGLPPEKEVLLGIALGYPEGEDDRTIEGKPREEVLASTGRKSLDEIVSWEQYRSNSESDDTEGGDSD